jgi:hypothetical protein
VTEDDKLILKQARRIAELEDQLDWRKEAMAEIHRELYGIGGPLNDNLLGYSKPQLRPFFNIAHKLGS